MAHTADFPVLLELVPVAIIPRRDRIRTATWNLFSRGAGGTVKASIVRAIRCKKICLHPLLHGLVTIDGLDDVVACALKNDGGDNMSEASHGIIGCLPLL